MSPKHVTSLSEDFSAYQASSQVGVRQKYKLLQMAEQGLYLRILHGGGNPKTGQAGGLP